MNALEFGEHIAKFLHLRKVLDSHLGLVYPTGYGGKTAQGPGLSILRQCQENLPAPLLYAPVGIKIAKQIAAMEQLKQATENGVWDIGGEIKLNTLKQCFALTLNVTPHSPEFEILLTQFKEQAKNES